MRHLTILGSTGSIGTSTLEVVKQHPNQYVVHALVAGNNVAKMTEQCLMFQPDYACMANDIAARKLKNNLIMAGISTSVMAGERAACELAVLDDVDTVMAAIVGIAGLTSTMAALRSGKRILLANKEVLVTCGRLFMKEIHHYGAQLLPVDSEHNAIFQGLPKSIQLELGKVSLIDHGISHIILTGSGGPFRQTALTELSKITPEQACAHPNWLMGRKISVDSATMMNKGLEYIEARWLFNAAPEQMEVLLHPQSIIHGMVRYIDGSVLAQLGSPNMCTPIAYALAYPERISVDVIPLNFSNCGTLTFEKPDNERYPCLQLAIEASKGGQVATTALNAANEIAVAAFLCQTLRFTNIAVVNREVLNNILYLAEPHSIEEVLFIDNCARKMALEVIKRYGR